LYAELTGISHYRQTRLGKRFLISTQSRQDESGWSNLGTFGSYLQKIQPDFDTRIYGFKRLSDLVKGNPAIFDIQERDCPGGQQKILYVRAKNGV
jgi:hypothetical protein